MSENANDPANAVVCDDGTHYMGLTKRELFAAMAMQALVSSNDEGAGDRLTDIPEYAVEIADALLFALATANRGEAK